jgi:hypothetical protein
VLNGNGLAGAPVISISGVSHAILRDFNVQRLDYWQGPDIVINGADQPGGRVFAEQFFGSRSVTNFLVNGLDYTTVEGHDFATVYNTMVNANAYQPGLNVVGGPLAAAGHWQGSITKVFGGGGAGDAIQFAVSRGGHLLFAAADVDGGGCSSADACGALASATGPSSLTLANLIWNRPTGQPPATLNDFTGTAALLDLGSFNGTAINLTGASGGASVLGLGLSQPYLPLLNNTSSGPASIELLNNEQSGNPPPGAGAGVVSDIGTPDPVFLTKTLTDLRTALPTVPGPLPSGVTDVRLYRVTTNLGTVGVQINP